MPTLDRPEDERAREDDDATAPARPRPSRRTLTMIVTPIIVLVVASWIGDASAAYLVDHHPLWLMALNARNRNLLLVTNYVDTIPYYLVGTLRLLLSDPLFYLLGYLYGDAGVKWMEAKAPTYGKLMRSAERFFSIATYPLVFLAPNNFICLFAGAAGMSIPVFLVLNVSGTIVRLYVLRVTGDIFDEPIQNVLDFIRDYRIPLIILSVLLVLLSIWNESRQGGGEIEALTHIDDELGVADEEDPA
jgi:membrane protein DedA with SNARE-associated domain